MPPPERAAAGKAVFNPKEKGWVISYSKTEKGKAATARRGKNRRKAKATPAKRSTVSILDPGNEDARRHIVSVCREIVRNYDIDGLIFDDYFYPDGLPLGGGYDFAQWKKECASGGDAMSQADWRRANVAKTIRAVGEMIAQERPWVRFGISPAGVGGGNGKATERYGLQPPQAGNDWMYDRIFCDPLSWLSDGSIDYVSPQIYWASDHITNPYIPIAGWWEEMALHFGRHCYPSQKVLAKSAGPEAWAEQELQVSTNRANSTGSDAGSIFYSTAHLSGKKASGLGEYLRERCYIVPALMPPMPWKDAVNPGAVRDIERRGSELSWYPANEMRYVVYAVPEDLSPLDVISESGANFMADYIVAVTYGHSLTLPADKLKGYWYAVAPYDRYGNEWEATIFR
ncbi:MAG: family 10 glycosylhydrolase [Muribaculaceae bacterium]|nr:family 10 glycosylhydrolase [Muribaculaceae bacterium]